MANTIFSGARFRLPYYATTGTDLTSVSQLTWTPSTLTLQINGGSMQVVRNSDIGLVFLNQHHSTPATSSFTMTRSRGTFTSQLPVQAGDYIGRFTFRANTAAGNTVNAVDISAVVDTGSVSAGSLNSKVLVYTRRGTTELLSLIVTSQSTSTSVTTGGVQIPQGGLGVDGAIYAGPIYTNGTRVSTFDGAYSSLTGKPTVPTNLDSLTDVTVSSPTTGQVLKYNGTTWVNDADATSGGTTFSSIIKTSKGNLTVPFDFDGNGTVELVDSTNGYSKMISSSKSVTGAPALTSFTWIEGTWATTTGSHAVISCVQGNSTNVLKKVVDLPPIETGDTMFIGNLDQNQRAASGYYVHGEQVGMFAYDNNGGQNETTSTMSIRTTTDGSGRMELRASGGIRTFNTLTVSGGLIATGSTAYMQTKSYTDTAARDTAITVPVAGMIVLAGTTFYGYNGSAWVAFN